MNYTLLQLQNLVEHASGELIAPDKRHRPDVVQMLINESIAQYYLRMTDAGHPRATTRVSLSTSATTTDLLGWPANSYVSLPSDFMALLSLRIRSSSGLWTVMHSYSETDTGSPGWLWSGDQTGMPVEHRLGTASDGTKIVRLRPYADAVYTIEAVYIPETPYLAENDTANLVSGTADWVVCDAALRLLESVGAPEQNQAQLLIARKNAADDALVSYASRMDRTGQTGMRDTRSEQRYARATSVWR
jgi:hypothetical protein